jgi:hypothetical protein
MCVSRKLSYNEYHYYASGRVNCLYALFKFDLKKRHCLFTTVGMDIIWPTRDHVFVEVPIDVPEYQLADGATTKHIPFELLICKLRDLKNIQSTFIYLKKFVQPV